MERVSFFGLLLACFGIPLAFFSFFVFLRTGLTVFGVACAILGGTLILTPWTPVPEPPVRSMLEGSCINIEVLLEEFDAVEKAIYLPPKNDRVYAFVPLEPVSEPSNLDEVLDAPVRVVTDAGGVPGLFVFPPGSELVRHGEAGEGMGLESALHHVMVDFVEAVESIRVSRDEDTITVEMGNPQVFTDFPRFNDVLGSLSTSIAGSVMAHALKAPIVLRGETSQQNGTVAEFEVVESG